tara:strand:+ start:479 stop:874 length:396 start_codon:yes stop_codon:yes gene_type:complete
LLEEHGLTELVWFFAGVMTYRTLAVLFAYTHMALFLEEINQQSLKLLGVISEDVAFTRSLKYLNLADSGLTEDEIEKIKEVDEKTFETWKNATIYHMISAWPRPYRKMIKFSNWAEAMDELTRIYKKNSKK